MKNSSILLIYTGGTIGMKQDPITLALRPFDFSQIMEEVPEIRKFGCKIDTISFNPLIDSSDADPDFWIKIVNIIEEKYTNYDGFVVLHGTDTMSYTASAISFMLEDLEKPVIFTGSQLPIGMLRTDGKENLISSIEIATAKDNEGHAMVPEVCVFFDNELYRGNRTTKYNAENFRAFRSANYPILADVGIHIKYNISAINHPQNWGKSLITHKNIDKNLAIIKIYPGISNQIIDTISKIKGLRAIILETYGSGNAPTNNEFLGAIANTIKNGIIVLNITQCQAGSVDMDAYATGITMKEIGVISGEDSTIETAISKMFLLLGQYADNMNVKIYVRKNLRGEISK